jgi:midasin
MVAFNEALARAVVVDRSFGRSGSPWEFNLRDVLRWCQLAEHAAERGLESFEAAAHDAAVVDAVASMFSVVYMHRFRTPEDRQAAVALFAQHFPGTALSLHQQPHVRLSPDAAYIGHARLQRSTARSSDCGLDCVLLRSQVPVLEAAAATLGQGWMLALVGPSAAGKTSVARILAGLAGAKLHEVR